MKFKNVSLILSAALLLFASCEREEKELDQAEAHRALNETEASTFFDELHTMTTEAILSSEGGRMQGATSTISTCATLIHEEGTRTTTLDFGTGCTDAAGNVRTGKIIISWSGGYFTQGSSIVTSLEAYTINGIQVAGTMTLTNITGSSTANPQFSVTLRGGSVVWPDGTTAEREVDHVRTWMRAANPLLDEWHIEGTASGSNRNGQAYTSTISSTIVYTVPCATESIHIPVKGSLVITTPNYSPLTVDFGDGSCDNNFLVSANGRSRMLSASR